LFFCAWQPDAIFAACNEVYENPPEILLSLCHLNPKGINEEKTDLKNKKKHFFDF
jgi:hypothetical protein